MGFDARATHTKNAGNRSRSLLPTNKFDPRKSNRNAYFDHELNAVQDYVEHKLGHLTKESLLKKTLIRVTNPLLLRIVIKIIKFSQGSKTLLIVFRVWIFSKHFVNLKLKIFLKKIFSKIEESAVISYVSILLKFSKKTATFLVIYLPIKGSKFLYWRILRKFLSYFG